MTVTEYQWKGAGEVRAYAAEVLNHIRERHPEPHQELLALVAMSLERESMVTRLYDSPHIHQRMTDLENREPLRAPIIRVVRQIVDLVWLQEAQHAEYLRRLKESILGHPVAAAWNDVVGALQGHLTEMLLSSSPLVHRVARIASVIGTGFAPSQPVFLKDLRALPAKPFCLFIAEMEGTAVEAYERMQTITSEYYARHGTVPFNIGFASEIGRIMIEERNHHALFRTIAGWFTKNSTVRRELTVAECARKVFNIIGAPIPLPESMHETVYAASGTDAPELLFDGGFVSFFRSHGIEVNATNETAALEWVGDLFLRGALLHPAGVV